MEKKYICSACGYVHTGDKAPEECPQCHQKNCFVEQKKGLNTESNVYTIIYATVVVVIVAILLALVSQILGPRQQANRLLDTQKQILVALNQDVENCQDPAALYKELIKDTLYVTYSHEQQFIDTTGLSALSKPERKLKLQQAGTPFLYAAVVDGSLKLIFPLRGQGLWGGIWGYMAVNDDRSTIFGINFGHESETPGLGGEIVTEAFRSRFFGKHILDADGKLRSVAVLKAGKQAPEGQEQVDAWSGATITSTGVNDMLINSLTPFNHVLEDSISAAYISSLNVQYGISQEE